MKWFVALAILLVIFGYKIAQELRQPSFKAQLQTEKLPYPVSPRAHVDDPSTDPLDPKTFPREVANSLAYARYAVGLSNHLPETFQMKDDSAVISSLKSLLVTNSVKPSLIKSAYETSFIEDDVEDTPNSNNPSLEKNQKNALGNLPADFKRLGLLKKRLQYCQVNSGESPSSCCISFLLPQLVLGDDDVPKVYSALDSQSEINVSQFIVPTRSGSVFKLDRTKDWLTACSNVLNQMPDHLRDLKQKIGDYHTWSGEFHPISLAKQRGRRIYRKENPGISVAETLDDKCQVRETEAVFTDTTNSLQFAVYDSTGKLSDFSDFPTGNGGEVARSSPEICLGCHLKFDSREFNVRIPSFAALRLSLFDQNRYHNSIDCAIDGENIFWDVTP